MKEYTIENLRADDACESGMAFVSPLIESGEFTPEKLLAKSKGWLLWAVCRGYEGRELVASDFGPQMDLVIDLIQRARKLTSDECNRLGAARDAARNATRGATRGAASGAARDATWGATWGAALGATWGATLDATRDATLDAAWGVLVRDLIGQHGFTQDHYDLLTGPWRRTIGRIHPDDADLLVEAK